MRKGHARHREFEVCAGLHRPVQAPGAADDKGELSAALYALAGNLLRQLLGGKHLPLNAHGSHKALRRNFCQDCLSLLLQRRGNLRLGRVLRHARFRQLKDLNLGKSPQPFCVLLTGAPPVILLKFSHHQQIDPQHRSSRPSLFRLSFLFIYCSTSTRSGKGLCSYR